MAAELNGERFLADLRALQAGAHVALAVSGGGDSMGMLALAAAAQNMRQAPRFSVLTVDHGLRPEAAAEAQSVAAACARLGLPHHILTADRPLRGADIQQQARRLRYRLMQKWCAAHAAVLALAHHRDDQAETVLMRMAKGSGIDGLAAMHPRQTLHLADGPLQLIRPFLRHAASDLKAVAERSGLPVAQDPSNFDTNFERVRWRKLMPHLAELGMDAARLADLADSMRATRETLNERLFNWLDAYADWHDYGVLCLPREAFLHLPEAYQGRLLSYFTRHFGGLAHPKKRAQIARLGAAVAANERGGATLGGVFAHWRRDRMFLGREAAACDAAVTGFSDVIWDRRFAINGQNDGACFTIAALGPAGVQHMRDDGMIFDDAVPAAYYAALPGLWQDGKLQHGLMPGQDAPVQLRNICELGFARDTLGVAQDW